MSDRWRLNRQVDDAAVSFSTRLKSPSNVKYDAQATEVVAVHTAPECAYVTSAPRLSHLKGTLSSRIQCGQFDTARALAYARRHVCLSASTITDVVGTFVFAQLVVTGGESARWA
jgi:hypothetical protein